MENIKLTDLLKIPYLNHSEIGSRFISTSIFHAEGNWRMWIAAGDQLIETKAWPAEAFYFSTQPEATSDLYLHFLNFIAQQASFPEVKKPFQGLHDDIFNLTTVFAKISHLHTIRDAVGTGVSRMVITEIEYLFSVCRSIFDLLQEIISALWETIYIQNPSVKKRPLKDTFSDMVLFKGRESTEEELSQRFGLPQQLAAYYIRNAEFFLTLKTFRDNIIHRGSRVQFIFSSDSGFLIKNSLRPFSSMEIWREDEKQPNDLVPLMPALSCVVYKTLLVCEDFSSTIEQIITFPSPLAPGMHLFMRGYFNEFFIASLQDVAGRLSVKAPQKSL